MKIDFKRVNWKTVLIAGGVLVLLALGVQSCRAIKAERALVADRIAVKQAKANETLAKAGEKKALKGWAKANALAKEINDKADKAIADAWKKEAAEHAALDVALGKIKTLTGDQLAADIGFRIGEQNILALVAGGFSLTRSGGENTFSLFLKGEQAVRDLETEKNVSGEKDAKITASALKLKGCEDVVEAKDKTIAAKDTSLDALRKNLHDAEVARSLKFWKGLAGGTILGAAIVTGLKLAGVIWK